MGNTFARVLWNLVTRLCVLRGSKGCGSLLLPLVLVCETAKGLVEDMW